MPTGRDAEAGPSAATDREPPAAGPSRLLRALEHAAHFLPAQAPLEVFVHHNTLHAFQSSSFHDALSAAKEKLGGEGYLPERAYRAAFRAGRISARDLSAAFGRWLSPWSMTMPSGLPNARAIAEVVLLHGIRRETRAGLAWRISERHATTEFAPDVSTVLRDRIARETITWLGAALEDAGPAHVAELVVGRFEETQQMRTVFAEEFGGPPTHARIASLLVGSPAAVSVAALWQACRRVSADARDVPPRHAASCSGFFREAVVEVGGDDPDDLVHPVLVSLAGAFLDRGQSHWSMPDREHGFFVAFCRVLGSGHAVRPSWLGTLGARVRAWTSRGTTAEGAIVELLVELGIAAGEQEAFIEDTLLALPGWAGMFHRLEAAPGPVGRSATRVRLVDFLAVRLVLDVLALYEVGQRLGYRGPIAGLRAHLTGLPSLAAGSERRGDHEGAWPLFLVAQHLGIAAPEILQLGAKVASVQELLRRFDRASRLRVWHEAYEAHYRDGLLRAIEARRADPAPNTPPRFQIVTCIDDRAEGLRRHFEELSSAHRTFGVAGFFNLAIAYQGIDDPSTFPLCPVVMTPAHRIREEPISEHALLAARRRSRKRYLGSMSALLEQASKSIVWGPLVTAVTGFVSTLPLLAAVFTPFLAGRLRRRVESWLLPAPKTRLTLPPAFAAITSGAASGFTIEEKVARVGGLLEDIGLTDEFARIVVICGHDSSSVNNPHAAAYSCGACGGRSGGPNARLFARMANRREVRRGLREHGIDLPDATVFIGAVHDTCADRIVLLDADELPVELMPEVTALQNALDEAARRVAHERCRRFASAPRRATFEEAARHVEGRSYDLSQARPELGHATNAACIVGRRALSRGLFLDRRVFLASYDPALDPTGATLERILLAVGPVGAGINLEYLFSTTDNEVFGAGTKLPHNVTGLFGVMNGASSDLRTGLPKQMIEIHEPLRLQLVVETTRATASAIVARQAVLRELVENEWVRLVVIEPDDGAIWTYADGSFSRWVSDGVEVPIVGRSLDWYRGKTDHLEPARIIPRADGARSDVRVTIRDESGHDD